jgi:hypothetical protein
MLTDKDVITHTVDIKYTDLIISNAKLAEIGGKSQFRSSKQRHNNLSEDQLVGQISTFCGSIILTGSSEGYIKAREKANKNPKQGDGGVDIIGLSNVDIKGSLMRYSSNPLNYRLLVRPKERHDDWIYVLGLVPKERPYKCHLVGWAKDSDLPKSTYNGPIQSLHGSYVIEAINLRNMNDLIKDIKNV